MRKAQNFQVRIEYENDIDGKPAHEPQTIAVSRNSVIRTAVDAVAHITATIGKKSDGQPITRIHHKDADIGEYFSVVKATAVRADPFDNDEVPVLQSIEDAPQPEKVV